MAETNPPPATPEGMPPWPNQAAAYPDGIPPPPLLPPPSRPPYRSLARLSGWVVALLEGMAVLVVIDIAMSVYGLNVYELVQRDVARVGQGSLRRLEILELALLGVWFLTYLGTGIVFLIWFNRCYRNLQALGSATRASNTPGWAVGAWFVPFLNLYRPKQMMDDLWVASIPQRSVDGTEPYDAASPLITWWWVFWLLFNFAGQIATSLFNNAESAASISSAYRFTVAADVVTLIAALLAISVVMSVTRRQQNHALRLVREGTLVGVDPARP